MAEPVANLDEIRSLLAQSLGPDIEAGTAASARQAQLTNRPVLLTGWRLAIWLATWQARHPRGSTTRALWSLPAITASPRAARFGPYASIPRKWCELHRRRRRGEPAVPGLRRRPKNL